MRPRTENRWLESTTLWTLISVAVAILIGAPSLYLAVKAVRGPSASILFKITAESNVLDLHEPVADLAILYHGEDIKAHRKNLRIITITGVNNGGLDIRQEDYDRNLPWGLRVLNARVVEGPRLVDSNSEYVMAHLGPTVVRDSLIEFNKIILDRGDYFTIQFEVLHEEDIEPRVEAVGKIVGIGTQPVIAATSPETAPSFWRQVFLGNALVLGVRTVVYAVGTLVCLLIIILVLGEIDQRRDPSSSRRVLQSLENYLSNVLEGRDQSERETIKYLLVMSEGNPKKLGHVRAFLESDEEIVGLNRFLASFQVLRTHVSEAKGLFDLDFEYPEPLLALEKGTGRLSVRPGVIRALDDLMRFLVTRPIDPNLVERLKKAAPFIWRGQHIYYIR